MEDHLHLIQQSLLRNITLLRSNIISLPTQELSREFTPYHIEFGFLYTPYTTEDPQKEVLSKHDFDKIPLLSRDYICKYDTCSICLENICYKEDNPTYDESLLTLILKCGHVFHKICIKKWLIEESNLCPLCKFKQN